MKAIGLRSGLLSIAWILLIWLVFIPPVLGAEVNNLQAAIDEYMNATVKTGRFNGSILVAQKAKSWLKKDMERRTLSGKSPIHLRPSFVWVR